MQTKEYKTTYDWVGKVIHWELCTKFKFDHTKKGYMHNPEWYGMNPIILSPAMGKIVG